MIRHLINEYERASIEISSERAQELVKEGKIAFCRGCSNYQLRVYHTVDDDDDD